MTTILLSLTPVPVEVTYDQPGLSVAMTTCVWNGSSWTQVGSPVAVPNSGTGSNTYAGMWTPPDTRAYLVELAVFTDNTFTTYQSGYYASSRSFLVDPSLAPLINNIGASATIVGVVVPNTIEAVVESPNVYGIVEC